MAVEYEVLTGVNYGSADARAEAGDILPDGFASKRAIKALIEHGAIAVVEEPAATAADSQAEPVEDTTPTTPLTNDGEELTNAPDAPTEAD